MNINEEINRIKKMMGLLTENQEEWSEWTPLYRFLSPIFGEKHKKAADAWMYMMVDKDNIKGMDVWVYKNGMTRKSLILDIKGESYVLNPKTKELQKEKFAEAFKRVYQDYDKIIQEMIDDGYQLSQEDKNDIYMLSYHEYKKWREDFLQRKGFTSKTVDGEDEDLSPFMKNAQ